MNVNIDSPPEFSALILAARSGARLFPLSSSSHPKHVLPVAGIALFVRQVHVLAACGFTECVIALASEDVTATRNSLKDSEDMQKQSNSIFLFRGHLKITLHHLPDDCSGSMQALRDVEDASLFPPSSHVIVIPGDLVLSDKSVLEQLAETHRRGFMSPMKTSFTMLLADVGEEDENGIPLKESAKAKKNVLSRDEDQIEYVALSMEPNSSPRVVWKQAKLDVEDDEHMVGTSPKVVLPKPRLRFGSLTSVTMDLYDVHLYVLSPWVRQLYVARASLVSIKGDLIPLLIDNQFLGIEAAFGDREEAKAVYQSNFPTLSGGEDVIEKITKDFQTFAVSAHVVSRGMALRACTVPAYLVACREIVSLGLADVSREENPCLSFPKGAALNAKFNSVIMKDAELGEKNQIKSSIVGSGSKLGAKCKLNNVVIMSNVKIGENVVLQNAVLGEGCVIGDNCSLSYVRVGHGKVVSAGTKEKGDLSMDEI